MGTINYKTSDYITLSIKPYDFEDIKAGMIENYPELIEENTIKDGYIYSEIGELYDCDKENAQSIIDKFHLWYFRVAIEPGYYEGLSIDINNNFPVFFDNYEEKKEAQKEVTRLKQLLIDLAGVGYVQTFPGWVTGYNDYKNTINGIKKR